MKETIKRLPVIGPASVRLVRKLRGQKERKYIFKRIDPASASNGIDNDTQQILNLLNYTKTSGSDYNAQDFPAGYHTIDLNKLHVEGQRKPKERLQIVPYDFTGKTVLDIGCNQGGMLFSIADKIAHGVGIDYDYRLINASNRIKGYTGTNHLDFYVFDLEKEDLNIINDLIPGGKVDIVFLLAVCMWIRNWKQVIDQAKKLSSAMLFESNGAAEVQNEQVAYLRARYKNVQLLSEKSNDDISQHSRRLYLCT
jgi:2-polyprenyl-3-methyl-5-hydroxy-6-metoxy-1,4-benzoquinol methylase